MLHSDTGSALAENGAITPLVLLHQLIGLCPIKMAIIADAESFTITIKNSVESEVTKVASNLYFVVSTFASKLTDAMETQFQNLKTSALDLKGDINDDISIVYNDR